MSLSIRGIGTANPPTIVSRDESLGIARVLCSRTDEHRTWLPSMYEGTRLLTRRICLDRQVVRDIMDGTRISQSVFLPSGKPDDLGPTTGQRMKIYAEEAPPLALEASRKAIAASGIAPEDFTHLMTVSCTGFLAPGLDRELIAKLPLSPSIQRTHVGYMGCHGAVNAIRVAQSFAEAKPDAVVLIAAVELCSLHYHFGWESPGKVIANAVFADGAAALVGTGEARGDWKTTATGSHLFPNSADEMTWTVGDHGFEMTLTKKVPALIGQSLRPWFNGWLAQHGLTRADIGSWAIHPGGPRILDATATALELTSKDMQASWAVYEEFGNMSSPTVLFILDRLRKENAPRPCVMLGFGPGLCVEAALIK
ncbi:MAG: type III polyketide synthase [Planctomycetes bacterium]|nr:type III polyketide synthase [Planctomycetota bacterium]